MATGSTTTGASERSFGLLAQAGIFVVVLTAGLRLGRTFLAPVALSWLLSLLLKPIVRGLRRRPGIPISVTSLVLVAALGAAGIGGVYVATGPVMGVLQQVPRSVEKIEEKLVGLRGSMQSVSEAAERLEGMTEVEDGAPSVRVEGPGLAGALLDGARAAAVGGAAALILLFFLLSADRGFLRSAVSAAPSLRSKRTVVRAGRGLERDMPRYLMVISTINFVLACLTAVLMRLLGVPSPLVLGAIAGILNFVPYAGAIVTTSLIAGISILTFDSVGRMVLPPLLYLGLTGLEGNFVTPLLLGHRFVMKPSVILINLMFWAFVWGIPGALLSVPLLVCLRSLVDYVGPLRPLRPFLVPHTP